MKVDSQEFKDLMEKWSQEAWAEEMENAHDDYLANEDMHGRLSALRDARGGEYGRICNQEK